MFEILWNEDGSVRFLKNIVKAASHGKISETRIRNVSLQNWEVNGSYVVPAT